MSFSEVQNNRLRVLGHAALSDADETKRRQPMSICERKKRKSFNLKREKKTELRNRILVSSEVYTITVRQTSRLRGFDRRDGLTTV